MSERVPAWAESDERYPEREAEWRAAIARAERAEAGLSRAIDVTNERDGLRLDLAAAIARAERAEAGLAALWDAGYEVRAALVDRKDPGRRYFASIDALGAVLVDAAAAAEAYRASVVAPWKAALDAARHELQRTLDERDTLASALAESRRLAGVFLADCLVMNGPSMEARVRYVTALAALPADLAADAFRRARAEALEAAADAIERGSVLSQYGAHGWLRARALDERGAR